MVPSPWNSQGKMIGATQTYVPNVLSCVYKEDDYIGWLQQLWWNKVTHYVHCLWVVFLKTHLSLPELVNVIHMLISAHLFFWCTAELNYAFFFGVSSFANSKTFTYTLAKSSTISYLYLFSRFLFINFCCCCCCCYVSFFGQNQRDLSLNVSNLFDVWMPEVCNTHSNGLKR